MIYCHKCKSEHEGWDIATCRKRKMGATQVPTLLKKALLCDPRAPVPAKKPRKQAKPVVTVTPKPVTVTNRMTELRKRKAAEGLIQVALWVHPDDMAEIKKYAKELADKRC